MAKPPQQPYDIGAAVADIRAARAIADAALPAGEDPAVRAAVVGEVLRVILDRGWTGELEAVDYESRRPRAAQ